MNNEIFTSEEDLQALNDVFDQIINRTMSLREGVSFLEAKTGRFISHEGLRKKVEAERARRDREETPRWETHPEEFQTNEDGSFKLKVDGTPKRKVGKRKGSTNKSPLHSVTKAKLKTRKEINRQRRYIKKVEDRLNRRKYNLKKKVEVASKLDDKLTKPSASPNSNKIVSDKDLESLQEDVRELVEEELVGFRPHPGPQTDFLAAPEFDVLYGGAAGGGKSYAMIMDPLRYIHERDHNALILRKTLGELEELISKSRELYPFAVPGAKYKESKKTWEFPSGARVKFGYLERDSDVYQYQGQSYTWIGFDELTHLETSFAWDYLRSRVRTTNPRIQCYMRACVDEGEVLTKSGWKDIRDVVEGEEVYSLERDGNLVLKAVTSFHEYDVKEKLVRVRKKNLYMSMTPDHRVVYKKFGKELNDISRWNEIDTKSVSIVRTSTSYASKGWSHPIICPRFLGLYIAEGSYNTKVRGGNHKVIITQCKTNNHPYVKDILNNTGLNYSYSKNGDFQISNKVLREYVSQFGKSKDKHFPRDFLDNATYQQLEDAFEAYAIGGGHWQSPKSCTLVTCSKRLSDDLCEIAIKLGYKVQVNHKVLDNPNHNDRYSVYVTRRDSVTKVDKNLEGRCDSSLEDFEGKVYCLGVKDTENFILRQRGFVWVSGNTTNPGGPGHKWVKERYIDPVPPNTTQWMKFVDSKGREHGITRKFIPAKLSDNPSLAENGQYETLLASLGDVERKRLLEGDWNINEFSAFPEFDMESHVIDPFLIPANWERFKAIDYGYRAPSCCLWFAVDPTDGTLILYRELYEKGLTGTALGNRIHDLEADEYMNIRGVLDGACWNMQGTSGPTVGEEITRTGHKLVRADKNRAAGKIQIHERLRINSQSGRPKLQIFRNCEQVINQLSSIPLDPRNKEDVDTKAEDHAYDALRYGVMSRPRMDDPFMRIANFKRQGYEMADPDFGY